MPRRVSRYFAEETAPEQPIGGYQASTLSLSRRATTLEDAIAAPEGPGRTAMGGSRRNLGLTDADEVWRMQYVQHSGWSDAHVVAAATFLDKFLNVGQRGTSQGGPDEEVDMSASSLLRQKRKTLQEWLAGRESEVQVMLDAAKNEAQQSTMAGNLPMGDTVAAAARRGAGRRRADAQWWWLLLKTYVLRRDCTVEYKERGDANEGGEGGWREKPIYRKGPAQPAPKPWPLVTDSLEEQFDSLVEFRDDMRAHLRTVFTGSNNNEAPPPGASPEVMASPTSARHVSDSDRLASQAAAAAESAYRKGHRLTPAALADLKATVDELNAQAELPDGFEISPQERRYRRQWYGRRVQHGAFVADDTVKDVRSTFESDRHTATAKWAGELEATKTVMAHHAATTAPIMALATPIGDTAQRPKTELPPVAQPGPTTAVPERAPTALGGYNAHALGERPPMPLTKSGLQTVPPAPRKKRTPRGPRGAEDEAKDQDLCGMSLGAETMRTREAEAAKKAREAAAARHRRRKEAEAHEIERAQATMMIADYSHMALRFGTDVLCVLPRNAAAFPSVVAVDKEQKHAKESIEAAEDAIAMTQEEELERQRMERHLLAFEQIVQQRVLKGGAPPVQSPAQLLFQMQQQAQAAYAAAAGLPYAAVTNRFRQLSASEPSGNGAGAGNGTNSGALEDSQTTGDEMPSVPFLLESPAKARKPSHLPPVHNNNNNNNDESRHSTVQAKASVFSKGSVVSDGAGARVLPRRAQTPNARASSRARSRTPLGNRPQTPQTPLGVRAAVAVGRPVTALRKLGEHTVTADGTQPAPKKDKAHRVVIAPHDNPNHVAFRALFAHPTYGAAFSDEQLAPASGQQAIAESLTSGLTTTATRVCACRGVKLNSNKIGAVRVLNADGMQVQDSSEADPLVLAEQPGYRTLSPMYHIHYVFERRFGPCYRQTLTWLDLSENLLTSVPIELAELPALEVLYLHGNRIEDLSSLDAWFAMSQKLFGAKSNNDKGKKASRAHLAPPFSGESAPSRDHGRLQFAAPPQLQRKPNETTDSFNARAGAAYAAQLSPVQWRLVRFSLHGNPVADPALSAAAAAACPATTSAPTVPVVPPLALGQKPGARPPSPSQPVSRTAAKKGGKGKQRKPSYPGQPLSSTEEDKRGVLVYKAALLRAFPMLAQLDKVAVLPEDFGAALSGGEIAAVTAVRHAAQDEEDQDALASL